MLVVFSASFSLSTKISSCVLCFFLVVINLSFLPAIVVEKSDSFNFEKGKTSLEHSMQLQEAFLFSKCCRFECLFCCTLYEPRYHRHHNKRPYDFEQLVFYIFYMETLLALVLFVIFCLLYWYFFIYLFIFYLFICRFVFFVCLFFLYILLLFCSITIS